MAWQRLEKILGAVKDELIDKESKDELIQIIYPVLFNNKRSDFADYGITEYLKKFIRKLRSEPEQLEDNLDQEYRFLSCMDSRPMQLLLDPCLSVKPELSDLQKDLFDTLTFFLENAGFMNHCGFLYELSRYSELIKAFPCFPKKTILHLYDIMEDFSPEEREGIISEYQTTLVCLRDKEQACIFDSLFYSECSRLLKDKYLERERKYEQILDLFKRFQDISGKISRFDENMRPSLLYALNYLEKHKGRSAYNINDFISAVVHETGRLEKIDKRAYYGLFMKFSFAMTYNKGIEDKDEDKDKDKDKDYPLTRLGELIDEAKPFSLLLGEWSFLKERMDEKEKERMLESYFRLEEIYFKRHSQHNRRENRYFRTVKEMLSGYVPFNFFNRLSLFYLNADQKQRNAIFPGIIRKIKDDFLSILFLDKFLKRWSLKEGTDDMEVKFKIMDRLKRHNLPDFERYRIASTIDKMHTDRGKKKEYNQRLLHVLRLNGNPDEALEFASIDYPDYIIFRKLGSGKFGTTYLMQNAVADKKVRVIKVTNPRQEDTISLEAVIYNAIGKKHRNLAEMYGLVTVEVKGRQIKAIDMEYIKGKTLRKILEEKGKLSPEDAIDYGTQVLNGLAYLHSENVQHRDLKPENIMVTEEGVVKLIDFGLATSNLIVNQPRMNRIYSAPEFKAGEESTNSDLWSFGLILYEMLAGKKLIRPSSKDMYSSLERYKEYIYQKEIKWIELQKEVDARYLDKIKQDIPRELQKIIIECLRIDPSKRCQNAGSLSEDLTCAKALLRRSSAEKAKEDYASRASGYGTAIKTYRDPVLREKSRRLFEPINPLAVALDIGCGQGDASTCLQEEVKKGRKKVWVPSISEVHYLDITPSMVEKGIEQGKIDSRFIKYSSASERLPYPNNTFDYIITRYFIHDLSPEEKQFLFWEAKGILKPGGKFQIIDMVADPETQCFYNEYHSKKTKGAYRQCWIPTLDEYHHLFAERGFVGIETDRYVSHVNTRDWLEEGQIASSRFEELNLLFRERIKEGSNAKEYFNLRETARGDVLIDFPVLLICGSKP
jgi:serine/threonine protein kinase